jgi:hypothetical protein
VLYIDDPSIRKLKLENENIFRPQAPEQVYNPSLTEEQLMKFVYLKAICHRQLLQTELAVKEYSYLAKINQKIQ